MASQIIKQIKVKAWFPGGRIVTGFTRSHPQRTDEPFQIWLREGSSDSVLINPSLAETVELNIEYEK